MHGVAVYTYVYILSLSLHIYVSNPKLWEIVRLRLSKSRVKDIFHGMKDEKGMKRMVHKFGRARKFFLTYGVKIVLELVQRRLIYYSWHKKKSVKYKAHVKKINTILKLFKNWSKRVVIKKSLLFIKINV